jgi:hypothetical protein
MSGDNPYGTSSAETPSAATSDRSAVTQARPAGTEFAQAPPAEPMSRAEYASYMRQRPANGTSDASGEDGTVHTRAPGHDDSRSDAAGLAQGMTREQYASHMRQEPTEGSDHPGSVGTADHGDLGGDGDPAGTGRPGDGDDQAAQAQGMTRGEYAGYLRQDPTGGADDPGSVPTGDFTDLDEEPGTNHPDNGADTGQPQDSGQLSADPHPAGQQAERFTPRAAGAENEGSAPDSSPGGASADTNGVAETGGGDRSHERPQADHASHDAPADSGTQQAPSRLDGLAHETPSHEALPGTEPGDAVPAQAAQPDEDHAVPDRASGADSRQELASLRDQMQAQVDAGLQAAEARYQASLGSLRTDYEAGKAQDQEQIDDLRAELQALRAERPQPAPDAPGNTGIGVDQPFAGDRERTTAQEDATEAKHKDDRPGLWSNAKTALYGAVGTAVTVAGADQFFPSAPHPIVDIIAGGISIVAAYVPVLREGWKRRHDNPPDKP